MCEVSAALQMQVPCGASPAVAQVPSAPVEHARSWRRLRAGPVCGRLGAPGPTGSLQQHLRHNFCFSASGAPDLVHVSVWQRSASPAWRHQHQRPPPSSRQRRSVLPAGSSPDSAPGAEPSREGPAIPSRLHRGSGDRSSAHFLLQNQSLCPSPSVQSPACSPRCRPRDPPGEQSLYNVIKY